MDVVIAISFALGSVQGYDAWWEGIRFSPHDITISNEKDWMEVSSYESFDEDYEYVEMRQDYLPPNIPPLGPSTSRAPTPCIELLVEAIPSVPLAIH